MLVLGKSECMYRLIFTFHEIEENEETRAAIDDVVELLGEFGVLLVDWVLAGSTHFLIIFGPVRRIFFLLAPPAVFGSF